MANKTLMKFLLLSLVLTALVGAAMAASDTSSQGNDPGSNVTVAPTQEDLKSVQSRMTIPVTTVPTQATETVVPVDTTADVQVTNTVAPDPTPWLTEGLTEEEYNVMEENARNVNGKLTGPSGRIVHYEIYMTDGYLNRDLGTLSGTDPTSIAGWPTPVYFWGFTDLDPNLPENAMTVPAGAYDYYNQSPTTPGMIPPTGTIDRNTGLPSSIAFGKVGNAMLPGPYVHLNSGDDVYITFHNRGMFQNLQAVEDDHSMHWHGIHAQSQYDGFPETAGGYTEQLRYFWAEPWYLALGTTTKARDAAWNAMTPDQQQTLMRTNVPLIKENKLNAGGAVTNALNLAPYPDGEGGRTAQQVEDDTQFTYYFRAQNPGTYMYHCHVTASEHVQMGMYGSLHINPADGSQTVYGAGTGTEFDKEYTMYLTSIDPIWHQTIESGTVNGFDPTMWRPQIWLTNGRTFPMTLFPHADNNGNTTVANPMYNSFIKVKPGQKFLLRWVNMDYADHSPHQHGWHMNVVGTDASPLASPYLKFTINIGSGETYDCITTADPAYGANYPAGSPLAAQNSPRGSLNWRQIYPIHDHYDYQVTTNGLYPGGGLMLMEVTNADGSAIGKNPTWPNPYTGTITPFPTNI